MWARGPRVEVSGRTRLPTTIRAQVGPCQRRFMMRFYNQSHRFYAGVDLHARSLYLCILDHAGSTIVHKNLDAKPEAFLAAIAPFRDGLVVGCECMFAWYCLADLCAAPDIPLV